MGSQTINDLREAQPGSRKGDAGTSAPARTVRRETWWATPIVKIELADAAALNAGLARIIREKEIEILRKGKPARVAGVESGLTAHWQDYNVLNWDYPECRLLRDVVSDGFDEFIAAAGRVGEPGMDIVGISCWANILRPGQVLQVHHHDPAFASAHYAVTTGQEGGQNPLGTEDSGHTVYFRPGFHDRSHGGKQNGPVSPWDDGWRISAAPRPGNLILFPSFVRHEVRPNLGLGERISIAMDIFVRSQEALMYFGGPRWYVPKRRQASAAPATTREPAGHPR